MKLKKQISAILLSVLCISSISSASYANDLESEIDSGEIIKKIIIVQDGEKKEITESELNDIVRKSNDLSMNSNFIDKTTGDTAKNNIKEPYLVNPPFYRYIQSSGTKNYHHTGRNTRISPIVKNETSNKVNRTLTAQTSYSRSSNVTLSTKEFNYINAQVGTSYGKNLTFSDSYSVTIPPNYQNWVEFYPIVFKSVGTLQDYYDGINCKTKKVTTYFSQSSKYGLDGVYTIKESKIK